MGAEISSGGILVITILAFLIGMATGLLYKKRPGPQKNDAPASEAAAQPIAIGINHPQLVAVMAAAIAQTMGTDPGRLRIHSIRKTGEAPSRGQLIAVVSAAVASAMGEDVNHLRIHAIRRV